MKVSYGFFVASFWIHIQIITVSQLESWSRGRCDPVSNGETQFHARVEVKAAMFVQSFCVDRILVPVRNMDIQKSSQDVNSEIFVISWADDDIQTVAIPQKTVRTSKIFILYGLES